VSPAACRALKCQRDTRSQFVAGVSTSYGSVEGFGFKDVCNDAGVGTYYVRAPAPEGIEVGFGGRVA
jgi:hypothetical protein